MSDELNPATLKRTQDILVKYVKKPTLTDKLLRKPPFRFLFDVFSAIIRDSKCFVGLYSAQELIYDNIKDRDDKMKFLQKMIDVVKLTTSSNLSIKTSKIVAGHEPERTNQLLQLMGEIIEKKLDWQKAVQQIAAGKNLRKESPRKPKEVANKVTKDSKTKGKLKEKPKEKDSTAKDSKPIKVTDTKNKALITNKEDKLRKSKTKESNTKQLAVKEKTPKANKEPEKSLKKPVNESSNKKSKLNKADSQTSNKDMLSLNSQEAKLEAECNHQELEQQTEKSKHIASPAKLAQNEVVNLSEVSVDNQNNSLQMKSLSAEKSKKSSAKIRKSSAEKVIQDFVEPVKEKEEETNLETIKSISSTKEKLEVLESNNKSNVKHESLGASQEQEKSEVQTDSNASNTNQKEIPTPIPRSNQKQKQPSPPSSLNNEIKRESTFTRENSYDSNKGSLANRPRTSLRPPSARPPSARPGAPRRRDKNIEIVLQPNDQIKMSGIQVKLETFGDFDDDGENLVIIENPNANEITMDQKADLTESEKMMQDETLEQGHLVQQILETQKELVQQQQGGASSQQKADKESVMRQTSARNMDNLRDVIQNITKSVNPLGKLMDFIPEDIDAMQLEFTLWRDTYTQAANELKREKSLTESAIEPMKNQLVEIEENIAEYVKMIDAIRLKILQNSEKIFKMLTT